MVVKEPPSDWLNLKLRHRSLCFTHLYDAVWVDFGQTGAEVEAGFDPFLSLPSVAEPDSDHLLLQMEAFGYPGYFLGGWLTFVHKAALQSLLSSQAGRGKTGERDEKMNCMKLNIIVRYALYLCSLQLIPYSCSPFPLPLIHSYFIIVQGCRKEKEYALPHPHEISK